MTKTFLTIKVIREHDGIQQGSVLTFADCHVVRQMIADGYYQLVKTSSSDVSDGTTASAVETIADKVKNIVNRFRK